ncbi:MAG: diphosphomevalonate decarboxylase [Kiritimatiellae bacterium]|nr:diphosphomevalonate decarboxylase [Kiritimatiellia bacterium]
MSAHHDSAAEQRRRAAADLALDGRARRPARTEAEAWASANIALVKYWGKRDEALHLPVTGSLSVSMGALGTRTRLRAAESDRLMFNGERLDVDHPRAARMIRYLDLFRSADAPGFEVDTRNTLPTAAGLASSASGFAALARAMDRLMGWDLPASALSALARLGSGSACRSVFDGFVEWARGARDDGMDSVAAPLTETWPGLCIGVRIVDAGPKAVGSGEGMRHTVATSPLYASWPAVVERDLAEARAAIGERDLERLGRMAEGNAMAMHATMAAARPSVIYWTAATLETLRAIFECRRNGIPVYATMDAGPNVKLIFESTHAESLSAAFPGLDIIRPFEKTP